MHTIYPIGDAAWQDLLKNAASSFDDVTLMRGFQYHKQGRVQSVSMPNPQTINAVVTGNETYTQVILLDRLPDSSCTCPVHNSCKHIAAALLEYADMEDRSVQALVNARSAASLSRRAAASSSKQQSPPPQHMQQIAHTHKLAELADRFLSLNVKQWHEIYELCAASLEGKVRNHHYVNELLANIASNKPLLPLTTELLFQLNAYFFVMEKLMQPPHNPTYSHGYYNDYFTSQSISDLRSTIMGLFGESLTLFHTPDPDSHAADTLAYIREGMLRRTTINTHYAAAYYQFWKHWVRPAVRAVSAATSAPETEQLKRYEAELQALQSQAAKLGSDLATSHYLIARCWMLLYLKQDQAAIALFKEDSSLPPVHVLNILTTLSEGEEWQRLLLWLVETRSLFADRRREGMIKYFEYWGLITEHLAEAEQPMWDALASMLPYSRHVYEDMLLRRGQWRRWMDYQLTTDSDPMNFRVSDLQPLEKHAPELLLPFYHQAVERYVALKNRAGYKTAVKLMKRLAKLYKKLKQETRFEEFVDGFANRHSRLRALQEELRKGKLIS
jgi:hypothetical protein